MAWKLGSDPEGHPLWERQVELEMLMIERGADRYRSKVAKAIDKQEMTSLRPYRRILEDMVDVMGKGLTSWLQGNAKVLRGKRGARSLVYDCLKGMDPYVCAFVTARALLDGVTIQNTNLRRLASAVGAAVEYEARMASWLKRDPKLFHEVQRSLTAQKATAQHRKRVNINRFNKLIKTKHRWRPWTRDEHLHVGLKLLDILARVSGHVQITKDPAFKRMGKKEAPYMVTCGPELLQYLEESTTNDQERTPQYLPCLMPPKRWEGVRRGGYYTPLMVLPRLIRFKTSNEEVQGMAADEYDALDMPKVFSALDKVQEVPWRVNQRVLAIAHEAWERDMAIGKLGKREPLDLPAPLPGQRRDDLKGEARKAAEAEWQKKHPKKFAEWKRLAATTYGDNARRVSNGMAVRTTLEIADMFAKEEFYFPHMLDFRGRMYPIPAYLQPQGNDLARGLLTFAHGRPVGEWGLYWLAVHLANCWGNDKVSYDERRDWVESQDEMWVRIANAPLKNLEWTKVDDPWQTLAAILEYARVRCSDNPPGEVSSLPVRVDGTCNGIQHLSALMRDAVGGASVNLMPGEKPRDIYAEVAAILQERLEGIRDAGGREGQMADMWLQAFGGTIPRKFTKSPVMVTPYGGTKDSFKGSTMKWLTDANPKAIPDSKTKMLVKDAKTGDMKPREMGNRFAAALWIVPHLWDSVAGRVVQGRVCMQWLQDCARLVADAGQPIWWTTSVGFHVRHFYGKLKRRRVTTLIDGKRVDIVDWVRTKEMSKKDQLQGIAPNFVHSQDGAVNMETILLFMQGDDPPPFTTIHDAFGTVAGEMWPLFQAIREAFVRIHSTDVLHQFRVRCVLMLRDHLMATKEGWGLEYCWVEANTLVPEVPIKGELDIEEVRNADYFFA